jgi:hypothetical protein
MRHKKTSTGRSGLSGDIQQAIAHRLREQFAVERSLPARLANLLKEFEQRSNEREAIARGRYASAARNETEMKRETLSVCISPRRSP